jgi:hypothetical protein
MRVQVLRSFSGDAGIVRRGALLDLTDYRAGLLLRRGLVSEVKAQVPAEGARGLGPTRTSRRGGRTGAETSPPSSPADPAPRKRRSRKRADEPASSS